MKNALVFVAILLLFISCKKVNIIDKVAIHGTWNWVRSTTDYGLSPTPASVGYNVTYTFNYDNMVAIKRNGMMEIVPFRIVGDTVLDGRFSRNTIIIDRGYYEFSVTNSSLVLSSEGPQAMYFER